MHRIPLELRSQACLGESSTKMGDLLGSPRVAPHLLSFQPVNPLFAADPFTFACVSGFRSRARGLRAARTRRGAGKGPRRAELCGGRPVNPLFAADPFTFACVSGFRSRARGLRAARTRRGAGKGPRRAELCGGRVGAGEGGTSEPVNPLFAADPFTFACVSGFRSRARGLRAARTRRGAGKGPRRAELCGGRVGAGEGGTS
ncbi:hypothetical protein WN944_003283 [Citrus x changshan-huyou]|uniref:Uncharacterized protein n=1 Tax=Citrus x changshan-huyou TaxID=2935761 RepID=A0AAP0M1C1_9ROSI